MGLAVIQLTYHCSFLFLSQKSKKIGKTLPFLIKAEIMQIAKAKLVEAGTGYRRSEWRKARAEQQLFKCICGYSCYKLTYDLLICVTLP